MWQVQQNNHYTFDSKVRFSEVDHTGRITLPGIINYFQDCSTFQSEDLGLGIEHCSEKKAGMDPVILAGNGRTLSEDR